MPGGGNLVRCERYRKTPRTPRTAHARYYYTRSLVIDARTRPRHQRSRCQSAPRVMDRSHSRSASPREPARPQHRPPSPPSPPAFENRAYQHDEYDPNHNDSYNSNGPQQNGHKEPNGESKTLEAVNLELINLTPKNGSAKQKKDVEVDMNASNPYDEYFVPVNEHRKYMRGEKLYVTADKRGEKGGCKRPLCWTLLGLVVAVIVALIVLAATGILFTNSPTPLEPYNASISSARALGGITHSTNLDDHDHDHGHDHDHNHVHDHSDDHEHDHSNNHDYDHEPNTENENAEHNHSTEHINNQESDISLEENIRENDNQEPSQSPDTTKPATVHNDGRMTDDAHDHSMASDEANDNAMYVPRTIEGELKIDNEEFTPALEDPESDEYREFVSTFSDALKRALFDRNTLENGDNDIVLEVVKIRSGSIVVTYRIHWEPKYNTQNSDHMITAKTLDSILNNYLSQNNRMISIYHIAEDKMATKPVLDICQINNNDCEYGCEFDKRTLDFSCTCPHGHILDMKHPKKCMMLLENPELENSSQVGIYTSAITSNPMSEQQPNTEPVTIQKETMHNTFDWKQTSHHMVEITTETDADVNFSHIFGTATDENEKHVTEASNHQSESSEERNVMTTQDVHTSHSTTFKPRNEATTMSDISSQTVVPEPITDPAPEPEPLPETKSDKKTSSEISTQEHKNNANQPEDSEEPQSNPEPEPTSVAHVIPITITTLEPFPTSEVRHTTEQTLPDFTNVETQFVFENVMSAEPKKTSNNIYFDNTENLTTTDIPLITINDSKYELKSSYNFDNHFEITTSETDFANKAEMNFDLNLNEKLKENASDVTTTEDDWLEDTTVKPQIIISETSDIEENNNINNRPTEDRSSKAYGNEFYIDAVANQATTSKYNEREIEGLNTKSDDFSFEQITKNEEHSVTKSTSVENVENPTTTAVSISQIFFGKKLEDKSLNNGSLDTTTIPVLTGIEETRPHFNNVSTEMFRNENMESKSQMSNFEDVTLNSTTPGHAQLTTPIVNPITEYSIAKQSEVLNIDQNLMTVIKNTNHTNDTKIEYYVTTEKDIAEADITFDVINKLYNRSSKSYPNAEVRKEAVTETNDIFKEFTETTTISDWLTETVAEVNYQDMINENKNPETTEAPVTKIDEIISREMNKDDFEPDYLNMGSNNSKSLEHDEPLYGMLHDYDNEESVIKRVKNEPSNMVEETTKYGTKDIAKEENEAGTIFKLTTETDTTVETTTVSQYIYKLASTEANKISDATTPNSINITYSIPQVWENTEDDLPLNIKEIPKEENFSKNIATSNMPMLTTEPVQNSSNQNIMRVAESMGQTDNVTLGSNLNVTIYEISNHSANHSVEKTTNLQSAEYDDHETEMNPFLPEIENNKSLVKKLQEGHDIEPSNVNETQNENPEEQSHHNFNGTMISNNQTEIVSNGNATASLSENKNVKTVEDEALFNELLMHQNTSAERVQTSAEFIKDIETTLSPFDQLDDEAKDQSDQSDPLPISTFLIDTDDLDTTKDPFDRINNNSNIKTDYETAMSPVTLSETTTEIKTKVKEDNEYLSVVPIEQEKTEERQNVKNNYDRENIPELNLISDSPKKSDRRTVESSNNNSIFDNEA